MISHKHHLKVFYRHIDQMGIVYYSRYFEYFEEARTELLNSIGLNVTSIEKNNIFLPVISTYCEFKKGLRLEQKFIIETKISKIPKARLKINYKIYIEGETHSYIKGYTEHAFLNNNGKPIKAPGYILKMIKENWIT